MEGNLAKMSSQLVVQFIDMLDRYPNSEDIECKYIFNNYKIQDGDRIAIFKMGWKSLRNYILFEWVANSSKSDINSIIFSRFDLPNNENDSDDLYQFCYISGENVVQGISTPFQIYRPMSESTKSSVILTDSIGGSDRYTHLKQLLSSKDKEIIKLKEENAILKESLKAIVNQTKVPQNKNYDSEIEKLKEITEKLKVAVLAHQTEIDSLKIEIKRDKTNYKNLMLEKIIAEKKFEAICKKEATTVQPVCNFDLGNLQSIPAFPFDVFENCKCNPLKRLVALTFVAIFLLLTVYRIV